MMMTFQLHILNRIDFIQNKFTPLRQHLIKSLFIESEFMCEISS